MEDLHNQNQLEGRNDMHEEAAVDRITDLTDPLIHHILSFLEIKDVARTCVLSKTWNDIWKSVPTLDFLSLYGSSGEFMDIVDRVLHLHSMSNIKKLSLRCCCYDFNWQGKGFLDVSRVNTWISGAIMRNVEELSLTLRGTSRYKTFCPLNLFTCKSLTTLELNVLASFDKFYVPKHMSLPQLERLKLGGVTFSKEYNNELLSLTNCPVLKDLTLECCRWDDVRSFDISAPSIEHLRIISVPNDGQGDDSDYSPGLRDSSLKIHAPRLVSLTYNERIPKEFVLSSSLTLAEAHVDDLLLFFWNDPATETREQQIGVAAAAIRFLQLLSHVKVLSISHRLLKALSFVDDLIEVFPTFSNLKQLNVSTEETDGKALRALFQSAPILESLVFSELNCHCDEDDYNSGEFEIMTAGCCFLNLKTVCFKKFTGEDIQMWWVKLILERTKALQTMTIFYFFRKPLCVIDDETVKSKEEVMEGLSSLFRASATSCVLNFF